MHKKMNCLLLSVLTVLSLLPEAVFSKSAKNQAKVYLHDSSFSRGLIACVDCSDPTLLLSLSEGEGVRLHAVYSDSKELDKARKWLQSRDALEKICVDLWDGENLPYVDNLINLLIVEQDNIVSETEARRVLAPLGKAFLAESILEEPWPTEIDEWTHWYHAPDGNAVAQDTNVGPPRHLQWIDGPLWLKHHNTTISFSAMVSAQGRIFCILDTAPPGVFGLPEKWRLQARDAFNGTLLWERKVEPWGWRAWSATDKESNSRFDQPQDLQRRLIAVGDRVYTSLGSGKPVHQLDASTGETLQTYKDTETVSELLYVGEKLIVSVHRGHQTERDPLLNKAILALNPETGKCLWKREGIQGLMGKTNELRRYTNLSLAAEDDKLIYADSDSIVCLDLASGKERWSAPRPPKQKIESTYASLYVPDLCAVVLSKDLLLFGQTYALDKIPWNEPLRTRLLAFSLSTGELQWETECGNWGYGSPADVFVVDDLIWVHALNEFALWGLDRSSGEVKKSFSTEEALNGPHHHRCYGNKATSKYVLTGRRGVEFLGLESDEKRLHHWVRGACRYGILPCNGLLYAPPDPCMCYATAKVNGFLALSHHRTPFPETPPEQRLLKGKAFGDVKTGAASGDWPTYRHDANRSGSTSTSLGSDLKLAWRQPIGKDLSSVTVADGKVFVASKETCTLHALDTSTGKPCWCRPVGGPVDSPPTYHRGILVFGCRDGRVYCVRVSDGELVWRFQAARSDLRISAFGRMESPWPVHGSVLIHDGTAYLAAGRSSFLDGGIRLYALDPFTGRVLQERLLYSPNMETGEGYFDSRLRYDMPPDHAGAVSDLLVRYQDSLYMRQVQIDPKDLSRDFQGEMTEETKDAFYAQKQTGKVLDFGPQVTSTAGLLDGSEFNQSFWSFEKASHCKLLVHDDEAAYGVRVFANGSHRHARSKFLVGKDRSKLFADSRKTHKRAWTQSMPLRVRALVCAGEDLLVAGFQDIAPEDDPWAAYEGKRGGTLWAVSKTDGEKRWDASLPSPPVWDGMAAADQGIYIATTNGEVACWR